MCVALKIVLSIISSHLLLEKNYSLADLRSTCYSHWGKKPIFVHKFNLASNDLIGLNWPQIALNGLSRSWIFGQKWVFCHSVQSEEKLLDSRENTRLQNCCITRKHLRIFLLFPLFFDFLKLLRYSISICMNKTPICIQKNS